MDFKYKVGDLIELKKCHPCQTHPKTWEILEISGDVKLKCTGCGHIVFLTRYDFDKKIVKVIENKGV